MNWELLGAFILGGGFGVIATVGIWFVSERKQNTLHDMDQAEDYVNTLDDGTFLRLRSAVFLRVHRQERRQASGAA